MPTNCKNCGAPLQDVICKYCKTDYRGKPKLTLAEYNSLKEQFIQALIGRGNLYSSVAISALREKLEGYDITGLDDEAELARRFYNQPQIMMFPDPLTNVHVTVDGTDFYETQKTKRSLWRRIWWGE
jgi:hypothetical protein